MASSQYLRSGYIERFVRVLALLVTLGRWRAVGNLITNAVNMFGDESLFLLGILMHILRQLNDQPMMADLLHTWVISLSSSRPITKEGERYFLEYMAFHLHRGDPNAAAKCLSSALSKWSHTSSDIRGMKGIVLFHQYCMEGRKHPELLDEAQQCLGTALLDDNARESVHIAYLLLILTERGRNTATCHRITSAVVDRHDSSSRSSALHLHLRFGWERHQQAAVYTARHVLRHDPVAVNAIQIVCHAATLNRSDMPTPWDAALHVVNALECVPHGMPVLWRCLAEMLALLSDAERSMLRNQRCYAWRHTVLRRWTADGVLLKKEGGDRRGEEEDAMAEIRDMVISVGLLTTEGTSNRSQSGDNGHKDGLMEWVQRGVSWLKEADPAVAEEVNRRWHACQGERKGRVTERKKKKKRKRKRKDGYAPREIGRLG
eukprot:gb/GECH01005139.1/.p1 GENE.gb/GECH01005139.1/~~gb/GECH01005139.1/.p1  ORF type:complete len:432 (+),score=62.31 gb/GECH01005139.1/:1-1296(+)